MGNIKKSISYNMGRNILFSKIDYGENFLVLYNKSNSHKQIFLNFMQQMAADNSILFYVSHKTNQLKCSFDIRNFSFNIINDDVIHELRTELNKSFDEMEKKNMNMLLISDWSNTNLSNCGVFMPFLEDLIKRSKGLSPPVWRRRYRGMAHKVPFTIINAFESTNLGDNHLQDIIRLHERVYLLQENLNTFLFPAVSPSLETIFPKAHILPQQTLDKLVKDNLELIALLLLEKSNKSGYQILKKIASHFHCILSQGTLYPLLYQLEKANKIVKQNGKGREVIYSLSKETRDRLQSRKETQLKAYQHLASFFEWGGGAIEKH